MFFLYLFLFWVPTVASVVFLLVLGVDGLGQRPWVPIACCTIALLLQFFSALFSPAWVIGLVLQALLAIYLGVRTKLQM